MSLRIQLAMGPRTPAPPGDRALVAVPPAATWPFLHPLCTGFPDAPSALVVPDLHEAFVNRQTANTRLVTTAALYMLQAWSDAAGDRDVLMLASADRSALEVHGPELLGAGGAVGDVAITVETLATYEDGAPVDDSRAGERPGAASATRACDRLVEAFRAEDPRRRLALCVEALGEGRTAPVLVATASVCMEVSDLDGAERDLLDARELAPEWAAVHFEHGKLCLRRDDMEGASASFRAAAERMPRFASAWANLGATLGELDRPEEALAAFAQALACDPSSAQTLNNIGVVTRELGRLGESEKAFRRVIAQAPHLAFGYYNLGHTLFLAGRYQAALAAYVEGQQRDPERNPVQASRLAMCRLATGDAAGALGELQRATASLPREYRHQLLADTQTIAWALLTHRPDLPGWQQVHEWLTRELATATRW